MKRVISYIITLALIFTCLPTYQAEAEENDQHLANAFEETMQLHESGTEEIVTYGELIEEQTPQAMAEVINEKPDENSGDCAGCDTDSGTDNDMDNNAGSDTENDADNGTGKDADRGYSFEEAKELYERGKGTLVTSSDWAAGGSYESNYWMLANGSMSGDHVIVDTSEVENQNFDKALNIRTDKRAENNWDAQLFFKITGKIEAGDTLFYGFKMKGISSKTTPGAVNINTRIRPSNDSSASANFDVAGKTDGEWEQFYGSTVSTVGTGESASGYGTWVFQLGMAEQEFQLADLFIVNVSREPGEEDDKEEAPGVTYTFEEVMQLYKDGKGELVTYPGLLDEGAYEMEYQDNINETNFIVTETDVANQDFDKALNVVTTETGQKAWDAQIYFNLDKNKKIEKNDVLFFGCKVRGISSVTNKEAMFVTANTRIRPDRSTSENFDFTSRINADDENDWTQIYGAVTAPAASSDQKDGAWVFQLSNAVQELDIADVFVINFGKEFSKNQFPVMTKSYLGMEEEAQWRQEALERIERIRKADVTVKVVDVQGQPVKDAQVKVEQTRHAFGFGTIVNVDSYSKLDSATQQKYKEAFRMIAHNRAGFENALKSNYITDTSRQELVEDWLNYFEEQGIDVRGHVLIYGQDSRLNNVNLSGAKTDLENKQLLASDTEEGKAALREWTRNHIQTYVNKYKGRIYNWDVVNENMTSHDWSDRLGGYDALVEWFKDAHEADPEMKLTYNDYGILSRDSGHQNYHYDLCKYLSDNGAPMTTIGIQGHVSLISPVEIINILDRFSSLGKEIEITEFTYEDDDPELQAQFTRDFMIAVFSEEAVTSLTTWGFWEGCMYQPKAAMFDQNFNLKPNGEVWMDLVYDEWWTNDSGVTGESGVYKTRAFLGNHNVTVNFDGKEYTYPVELNSDGTNVIVTLDGNGNSGVHEHTYSEEWSSDADHHWHSCGCGEKDNIEGHIAGEWITDKEASDTESGSRHKACAVCGIVLETEEIPKKGAAPENGDKGESGGDGNKTPDADSGENKEKVPEGGTGSGVNVNSSNGSSGDKNNGAAINNSSTNNSSNNNNNKGSSSVNSAKTVKTGDTSNVIFWISFVILSGGLFWFCRRKLSER